jgi:formyltetrahydrofolate-dependent phosphoribosylglycinamide formyltransferase
VSRIRIAVLASGGGTTFENLVLRSRDGRLDAEIATLVVSRPDCGAVDKARRLGVSCAVVKWSKDQRTFDAAITAAVDSADVDLVCLGGFLKLWTIPDRWLGRVMNIHPALLPAFGGKGMHGRHVHEAVLAAHATESGCTVHFATNEYDAGPIILQKRVPVLSGDTPESLAARVFAAECEAYPEAITLFAARRLVVNDGRVEILRPGYEAFP